MKKKILMTFFVAIIGLVSISQKAHAQLFGEDTTHDGDRVLYFHIPFAVVNIVIGGFNIVLALLPPSMWTPKEKSKRSMKHT